MPIQIIDENKRPSTSKQFGQAFANLGQAAGQAIPQYLKDKTQTAELAKQGINVKDIYDPSIRNMLIADQLQRSRKLDKSKFISGLDRKTGEKSESVSPSEVSQSMDSEDFDISYKGEKPKKSKREAKVDKKLGDLNLSQGGQLPQQTTRDQPMPVMSGEELMARAQRDVREAAQQGIDYDINEALQRHQATNTANVNYNAQLESEKKSRREAQGQYGDLAVAKLAAVDKNATDEVKAYMRKVGERAAANNKSEAEIDKLVAEEAKDYKNALSTVRDSLKPARTLRKVGRFFAGGEKDIEKQKNNLRTQIKPLTDRGLYDTARAELAAQGWYDEEVESIIDDLEGDSKQLINTLPEMPKFGSKEYKKLYLGEGGRDKFQSENLNSVRETLRDILTENPDENLLLLRKSFEDKGYDWRTFQAAIDSLLKSNEIELSQEQMNKMNKINEPPLHMLEQLAYDLGFGGR